jgi:hypothetical protein
MVGVKEEEGVQSFSEDGGGLVVAFVQVVDLVEEAARKGRSRRVVWISWGWRGTRAYTRKGFYPSA